MNVAPRTATEELLVVAAYRLLGAYKRPRPADDLAAAARNLDAIARRSSGTRGAAASRSSSSGILP